MAGGLRASSLEGLERGIMPQLTGINFMRRIYAFAAIAILGITLPAACLLDQTSKRGTLALEIVFKDGMPLYFRIPGVSYVGLPHGAHGRASSASSRASAIKITAKEERSAVKIEITPLFGDLKGSPSASWETEMLARPGTSFLSREGDTVKVIDLAKYGLEPFEIKVLSARPVVLRLGQDVFIVNKTSSFQVEGVEKSLDLFHLKLKNGYQKKIVSFTLTDDRQGEPSSSNYHPERDTGKAIAPGAIYACDYRLGPVAKITPEGAVWVKREKLEITVTAVVFDDGTFDGNAAAAARILAARSRRP